MDSDSSDITTIISDAKTAMSGYKVYTTDGKLLSSGTEASGVTSVFSSLSNGTYIVNINGKIAKMVKK